MGLKEKYAALFDALTSSDLVDRVKYFSLGQLRGLVQMVLQDNLGPASARLRAFAELVDRHEDAIMALPQEATVTDFVSATLYVQSQSRPPADRWALRALPSRASKALAGMLLRLK